jgi:sarcinarray family protein
MRTRTASSAIVLFLVLLMVPVAAAGECRYGSVHAWFYASDGCWKNATAHPVLKRGEEFQIKVTVSTTADLQAFFMKLHEFGTPVYEVLTGPTQIEQLLEYRQNILSNQTFTYQWILRVRPTTSWTHGIAPLEVFTQFNSNDSDECQVVFDVITASIVDGPLGDHVRENNSENHSSRTTFGGHLPGVQVGGLLAAFLVLPLLMKVKNRLFLKNIVRNRSVIQGVAKKRR